MAQIVEVDVGPVVRGQPGRLTPAGEGVEISVGHREVRAHQEGAVGQVPVDPRAARFELRFGGLDVAAGEPGVEQRDEALVDLGTQEAQHLLER